MKKIYDYALLLMVLTLGFALTSCGGDDDENGSDGHVTDLVSTWRKTYYYGSYLQYTFNKDNTGIGIEHYEDGSEDDSWNFTYQYDEETGKLRIDLGDGDVEIYKVIFKNMDTIYLYDWYDPENDYEVYSRFKK